MQKLYQQSIWSDQFQLISNYSLEKIENYLSVTKVDIGQIEQISTTKISESLNCYTFHFKKTNNKSENAFLIHEKLVNELSNCAPKP